MKCIEKTAKSVDEAIKLALEELQLEENQVKIEIIEQPAKGIFGFIGSKQAKVKVEVLESKSEIIKPVKDSTVGDKDKEIAYKFTRELLDAMNIQAEIRIKIMNGSLYINLAGPKMGIIIGRRGQTLDSIQYLISLVVNKENDKDHYVKVILDTEDYRKKREETLIRLANRLAERVIKSGRKVELEPMNPYERRIIHSALQEIDQVVTYSEGEEPYRKVIIAHK